MVFLSHYIDRMLLSEVEMAFNVAVATEKEALDVAEVHLKAMQDNLLLHAQFPDAKSLPSLQQLLAKETNDHREDENKGVLVARDPGQEQVASFVKWLVHRPKISTKTSAGDAPSEEWPAGAQIQYLESYANLTAKARKDVIGDDPYYHVTFLCTRPEYQSQGAASMLLRNVLKQAEADGMAVVLESTMNAVAFYQKLGFHIAQKLEMMLPSRESSERTELYEEQCMIWRSANASHQ